jgi:hypothetical protein
VVELPNKQMTCLKNLKSLLQSGLAILEQCTHLALMKEILECATLLLSFKKGVDFVEGPDNSCQDDGRFSFPSEATYSVNFPM